VGIGTKLRSYYSAQWNDLKTGLTTGKKMDFITHFGLCIVCNGTNANFKLHNTTSYNLGIEIPTTLAVATGAAGVLNGDYYYRIAYLRDGFQTFEGTAQAESAVVSPANEKVTVTWTASTDPQVTKVRIFRTLVNAGSGSQMYKVADVANATETYSDNIADSALIETYPYNDNTIPPKAFFVTLHNNRAIYANLPVETDGGSKIMYSKAGWPEAVPAVNYHYFDRKDGESITGIASLGDYIVVFKKNKLAVIDSEFMAIVTVSKSIGCIAPWAILEYKDKVIFLSEEGWKAFDGVDIYDLSFKINRSMLVDGYVTYNEYQNYSAVKNPTREQFQYLIKHSTLTDLVLVGHFLVPLLFVDKGIPEEKAANIVSWTQHSYAKTFTCLGNYTDANGILRMCAGDNGGIVYQLDTGTQDDGANYEATMKTGWLSLGSPQTVDKTLRMINITYTTSAEADMTFAVDIDFMINQDTITLPGTEATYAGYAWCGSAYAGVDGNLSVNHRTRGTGKLFRFGISGTQNQQFILSGITVQLRGEGLRPNE